jgi:hypothetical protein
VIYRTLTDTTPVQDNGIYGRRRARPTLIKLLLRLYDPTRIRVSLDRHRKGALLPGAPFADLTMPGPGRALITVCHGLAGLREKLAEPVLPPGSNPGQRAPQSPTAALT